jgi:hypothetical protein
MAKSCFVDSKENLGPFTLFNVDTSLAFLISNFGSDCLQFMEMNIEVMS